MMHEKFKRMASLMLTAAMLVSNAGGVTSVLAEATPTEAEAAREVQIEPAVTYADAASGGQEEQTLFPANDANAVPEEQTVGLKEDAPENEPAEGPEDGAENGLDNEDEIATDDAEKDVPGDEDENEPVGEPVTTLEATDSAALNVDANSADGGDDETCEHVFKDGVCELCGYVCPHENKNYEALIYEPTSDWEIDDFMNHKRYANIYHPWTCWTCGVYEKGSMESDQLEYGAHVYDENGVCTVCDYQCSHYFENDTCIYCGYVCPHEDIETWVSGVIDEDSIVSISEKQHQYSTTKYEYWACKTCYARGRGEALGVETATENHWYDEDGKCSRCGHQNACQHASTSEHRGYDYSAGWKDDGNGRTHSCEVTEYLYWHCDDCGQYKSTEIGKTTKTEVHQADEMVPDACTYCHAEINCPHSQLSGVSEWIYCPNWKDDGNGQTHSGVGTRQRYGFCTRCDAYVSEVLEENVLVKEAHHSNDGKTCSTCGGAIACTHDKTYERISYQDNGNVKDNGDGTHTVYQDVYKVTHCKTCGYEKFEKTGETATSVEKHLYLPCPTCGAESKQSCEHAHTYTTSYMMPVEVKPDANGRTHSGTQTVSIREYCSDCQELIRTVEKMTEDICEPHEIDKQLGYCPTCGYIVPDEDLCRHEQSYVEYEEYRTGIAQNEKEHSYSVYLRKVTYCKQCGVILSSEDAAISDSITEVHEFDATGACWCGYRKDNQQTVCKHEHKRQWTSAAQTVRIVSEDDTHHTVEQILVDYTYCDDCDEMLEAGNVRKETVTGEHAYAMPKTGVCCVCGHVNTCKHPNADTYTEYTTITNIRVIDGRQHSYTACGELETTYCPDCGAQLGQKLLDSTVKQITEEHWEDAEGNTCILCGATITNENPTDQPTEAPTPKPTEKPTDAPTPAPTAKPSEDTSSGGSSSSSGSSNSSSTSSDTNFVPTPEPTATPAPTASEEMHETFKALDEIERETQQAASVEIEVVGMEEVMPEEMVARVQQLSVKEQLLMTLTAADCGSVAQSIVDSMNVTLTANAKTLFDELNTTPVEEQKISEVRQRMNELFPVHVILRDNVYYHVHVMTVNITVNGVKTTYYFGLRLDEFGLWQMIELTADEAGESTLLQK